MINYDKENFIYKDTTKEIKDEISSYVEKYITNEIENLMGVSVEDIKNVMKENGALNAMMSGSGPTVFGIYEDKKLAKQAQQKIKKEGLTNQVYVVNVHNNRRN